MDGNHEENEGFDTDIGPDTASIATDPSSTAQPGRKEESVETRPAATEEISLVLTEIEGKQKKYKNINRILTTIKDRTPPEISIKELEIIFGAKSLISIRINKLNHQNRLLQKHRLSFVHNKSGGYLLVKLLRSEPAKEIPIDRPMPLRLATQEEIEKALRLMDKQEKMGTKKSTTTRQILENLREGKISREELKKIFNRGTSVASNIARINTRNQLFKRLGLSLKLSKDRNYYTLTKEGEIAKTPDYTDEITTDLRRQLAEALERAEKAEKTVREIRETLTAAIREDRVEKKKPDAEIEVGIPDGTKTINQGSKNNGKPIALTAFRVETLENLATQEIDLTLATIKTAIFSALQKEEGLNLPAIKALILRCAILVIQSSRKVKEQDKAKLGTLAEELRKIQTETRKSEILRAVNKILR